MMQKKIFLNIAYTWSTVLSLTEGSRAFEQACVTLVGNPNTKITGPAYIEFACTDYYQHKAVESHLASAAAGGYACSVKCKPTAPVAWAAVGYYETPLSAYTFVCQYPGPSASSSRISGQLTARLGKNDAFSCSYNPHPTPPAKKVTTKTPTEKKPIVGYPPNKEAAITHERSVEKPIERAKPPPKPAIPYERSIEKPIEKAAPEKRP